MPTTVVPVAPFILNDMDLLVGSDDYAGHCSQVELTPTAASVIWKGLKKASKFTFPTGTTWVANVALAQDWETPNSLSKYLFDHEGEEKEVILKPRSGSGPSVKVTLVIAPGAIGGTVDAVAVQAVALGVQGRPEFIPAAA